LKVVGDVTTASGTNVRQLLQVTQQAPISNVYRNFDVTPLTTNISTSMAAYAYTEAKPKMAIMFSFRRG
jgi:hypothetical protein